MLIGYVRSLALLQEPYTQATRLIAAGCQCVFIETGSGDHLDRPVLHRAIDALQPGDVLLVGNSDRLSRSVLQTDILVGRLERRGATLRLLDADDAVVPFVASDLP